MNLKQTLSTITIALLTLAASTASAQDPVEYEGITFNAGESSFADSVERYELNDNTDVGEGWDDPQDALGVPDYDPDTETGAVSLGNAPDEGTPGELIVAFDGNRLIDVEGDDLYIFEVGTTAEASRVAVSNDLVTWYDLGVIEGDTRGVDLGEFPEIPEDAAFQYVRLMDVPNGSSSGGPYGGPDIDAVGAIGSIDASKVEDGRIVDTATESEGCGCSASGGSVDASALAVGALFLLVAVRRR
jgi:MYXO-CTERM domain-containing protein